MTVTSNTLEVRRAQTADRKEVSSVLAQAFFDDPVITGIPERR